MANIIFATLSCRQGKLGLITLNRPQAINALTLDMCQSISEQLTAWEQDNSILGVIVRGNGERGFCAGGDVRSIFENGPDRINESLNFFRTEYRMNHQIFHYAKPYIALLHGITMGGGAGLSINGWLRVATPSLKFAMPETGIGFIPDVGMSYFLSRRSHHLGVYLGLTGQVISASDAKYIHAVNWVVKENTYDDILAQMQRLSLNPENARTSLQGVIEEWAIAPAETELLEHQDYINTIFTHDCMDDILGALNRENSGWSQQTLNTLKQRSPTALAISLKLLKQAKQLSFDDCLRMEYQITAHCLRHKDFYEGVRAAVVDKDRNPQWQPTSLQDLTEDMLAAYFKPLSNVDSLNFTK